tara:strand:+ start:64 stop:831 length:768 start_codon:yes stop_codon:yes gene_type:complete
MKKCLNCNKKFSYIKENKKHCSIKCKNFYSTKLKQKYYGVDHKNCEHCNKKIILKGKNKKVRFCSKGCCRKAYRKTTKAKLSTYIYNRSDKRKACSEKYAKSKKGKLLRRTRETILRKNPKWAKKRNLARKVWDNNYRLTEKGKASRFRYTQKWYYKKGGKEKQAIYTKEYRKRPKALALMRARMNKRRAIKIRAIPKWCNLEKVKEIYKNCPKGYHVDHIVPLINPIVCGFHVENNLQYLKARENLKKGNKLLI